MSDIKSNKEIQAELKKHGDAMLRRVGIMPEPSVPVSRLRELLHVVAELDEGKVLYQQIGGEKIAALITEYSKE